MRHVCILLLVAMAAGRAPAGGVELVEPIRFDFAGVKMALPKKFEVTNTAAESTVFQTVLVEQDKPVMSLTLTAEAKEKDMTLAKYIDGVQMKLNMILAIGNMKVITTKRLQIAGTEAEVQVQSYTYSGIETTALRLFFLRPVSNADIQMAYLLTAEAGKPQGRRMLPVLTAVMGTIELFDPVSPISLKVDQVGPPIVSRRLGYSFRPPRWWKAGQQRAGSLVTMFQYDYLRKGRAPVGQLRLATETMGAEEVAKMALQQQVDALEKDKQPYQVLREGQARLGGQPGYEFIIRHRREDQPEDKAVLFAERTACANELQYTLSLLYLGGKKEIVIAALEKMASEMKLFSPEVPTTGTAPATTPAAPALPSGTAPAPPLPSTAPVPLLPSTMPGGAGE